MKKKNKPFILSHLPKPKKQFHADSDDALTTDSTSLFSGDTHLTIDNNADNKSN